MTVFTDKTVEYMIDWSEIKSKHPKAWKVLCKYHERHESFIDHPGAWIYEGLELEMHEIRHLYDFFDENDLNIYVMPEYYPNGINWNYQILWETTPEVGTSLWKKNYNGTGLYGDNGEYPTRIQAEVASYMHAFDLLESKL